MKYLITLLCIWFQFFQVAFTQSNAPFEKRNVEFTQIFQSNRANAPLNFQMGELVLDSIHSDINYDGEWRGNLREYFRYADSKIIIDSFITNINWLISNVPDWRPSDYTSFLYDTEGLLTESLTYDWDGQNWSESIRRDFLHNTMGFTTYETIYVNFGGDWMPIGQLLFTYDSSGNKVSERGYSWEPSSQAWEIATLDSFIYSQDGKLQTQLQQYYDSGIWHDEEKSTFIYNQDGLLSETVIAFPTDSATWVDSSKDLYYYEPGKEKPYYSLIQAFDEENNVWVDAFCYYYYYHEKTSSAHSAQPYKNEIDCYLPNPLTSDVSIRCETKAIIGFSVILTDLYGREMIRQPLEKAINIGQFPAGLFFVCILDKEGTVVYQNKVIKPE